MVYTTAILFGPLVGAFAGGVGSMFADLFLGYLHFAPATLIIKGLEGAIVGQLSRKKPILPKNQWKLFTFVAGLLVGILIATVGSIYYSGVVELSIGFPQPQIPNFVLIIPPEFWYGLGALVSFILALMGFVFDSEIGWLILTIIVGGLVMVTGYYLYEQLFLGVAALVEIPSNVGQMCVGLIVAVPLVRVVRRYLPSLRA